MKRRYFISLSTLTAVAVGVPFLNCSQADPGLDKILAIPQTLSQLQNQSALNAIGKAYGVVHPGEYSLKKLEQRLAKNSKGNYFSSGTSAKEIFASLDKTTQADFESGNTVILDGWVISLTEARQCALFSLISQKK
jgi:hypothetical protein